MHSVPRMRYPALPRAGDAVHGRDGQTGRMRQVRDGSEEPIEHERWPGWAADLTAALVVLLGGGLLVGSGLGPGFGGGPGPGELGGRLPGPPMWRPSELQQAVSLLLLIVPAALMFVRRRWPISVFAATFVLFCVAALGPVPSIGPGIALTVAAFTLANRAPRRTALIGAGVATGLILLLSIAVTEWTSFSPRVFQVAAALSIAAAIGDSARSRRVYLAAMTERAERAEQTRESEASQRVAEERLRIARELHDTVAHQLAVINLNAGVAAGLLEERPERAREALGTIREAARGGIGEIGELLQYLRAGESDGAATAPQPGLERLDALLAGVREAGLDVELRADGDLDRVTGAPDRAAYRLVQEGLTNALKHGSEHRAALRLDAGPDELRIELSNPVAVDGGGAEDPSGGLGLVGIRERVSALGGTVTTGRIAGVFHLSAVLPITEEGTR